MTIDILGTDYEVHYSDVENDNVLSENISLAGYCDNDIKKIVIANLENVDAWKPCSAEKINAAKKSTLRHEIVHAFLYKSGLESNSMVYNASWATNEEMVDWIALQGEKIYRSWQEAGAL